MNPDEEIRQLQAELLRLLRGANAGEPVKRSVTNVLRGFVAPQGEILRIRRRIRQLNPDASLYEGWGGAMP